MLRDELLAQKRAAGVDFSKPTGAGLAGLKLKQPTNPLNGGLGGGITPGPNLANQQAAPPALPGLRTLFSRVSDLARRRRESGDYGLMEDGTSDGAVRMSGGGSMFNPWK